MMAGMSSSSRRADMFIASEDDPREGGPSLGDEGEVLVHTVEEYARHTGHADLLRECIDGRLGQ
jgi:hypothetical protein